MTEQNANSLALYSRSFTIWTQFPFLAASVFLKYCIPPLFHLSKSQSFKIITFEQLFPVSLVSRCPRFWSASVSITVVVITRDALIVKCPGCVRTSVCVCVCVCVHPCMCQHAFSPFADQRANSEGKKGLRVCSLYSPFPPFYHVPQHSRVK